MRDRVVVLRSFFDVDNRQYKINEEKQLSLSPGFWDDNKRATEILKNIKLNEYWVKLFESWNRPSKILLSYSISGRPAKLGRRDP